ncbi:GtrA family protein [Prosthecodimorpha staleyi]|uniref:GtrA family protein n=1 Tax=Prosthecodimorpha staleyi TaxID=2840188 RepID=A0A947DAM2_9HYPH|nr:GtrA family protein [Prosthecodimorpha staleyi]MBT9290279.1 GtrA family protein [Prosthecodimorpha staleyi]
MSFSRLVLRYTAFAVLATLVNLATQRGILAFGTGPALFAAALIAGTGTGLVTKYWLDKHWIFFDRDRGLAAHSRQFTLYTVMGLATTAIFWGLETAFWLAWQSDAMREAGGVLGLAIGYVVKYNLDRRFVFTGARHVPAHAG